MNIYDVLNIEREIEKAAEENDGEIPDDLMQALVEAQTRNVESFEKLIKYVRHLQQFSDTAKSEEERIKGLREKAERRIENIKRYVTPYIQQHGAMAVGTFKLSTRKSERVELPPDFDIDEFMDVTITRRPNKTRIKEAIKAGKEMLGARLVAIDNLQIK